MSLLFSSCGEEAATLTPWQEFGSYVDTSSGTALLQVQAVYPTGADVAVDSGIVIVFTKGISAATVNSSNVILEQETAPSVWTPVIYVFDTTVSDGDRIIHINPEPDGELVIDDEPLVYGENYRVRVVTGVTALDGQALNAAVTANFTTMADTSSASAPYVLAATRTPIGNTPRVSINAGYVEVTFSASMNPATITSSTFTITGGIGSGEPNAVTGTNNKVFRRNITTAAYNTTYTVDLVAGSIQSAAGLNLVADGNQTWTFTTENDDGTPVNTNLISSVWVTDITDSSITLNWQTTDPAISTIDWGTGTDYTGAGYTETEASTIHSYTIPVSSSTKYYFTIIIPGFDTETGYVFTKETGVGNDTALSTGGSDRSVMRILMDRNSSGALNGRAFVTWLTGGDLRASYVTGASETWEGDIATTGTLTDPRFFSDGRGYSIVTMQNGTGIYAKMVYNNGTGPGFQGGAWGVDAAAAGISVGTGSNAGASVIWGGQGNTNVDAGTVSVIVASGTAVVLPAGNWFYDFDTDFTSYVINNGYIVYSNIFNIATITDDGTLYRYAINQNSLEVSAGNGYTIKESNILDPTIVSGTADALPGNNLLDNTAGRDYTPTGLNVLDQDYVFNLTDNLQTRVAGNASKRAMLELSASIFTNNDTYTILRFTPTVTDAYIYEAESDTSGTAGELNDSSVDFYALGVKKGDMVYNVTTGVYAVVAVAPASAAPNTLVLNKSIFSNGHKYIVFRVVDASLNAERLTETGIKDSGLTDAFLNDSTAVFNYAANPVYIGDVVHVRGGGDLLVLDNTNAASGQLTLSGNIDLGDRYSILQPRALIVYQNSGIYAKMYRLRDGSQYGATITVDATATAAYPQTVSDASTGGAFVFYERASTIYGRYVDGDGTVTSIGAAGFGSAFLVKAIADGSGNAYVLSESGTAVTLTKVSSGSVLWSRNVTDVVTPGVDSNMILDSTGQPVVVFSSSANIYVRKYNSAGADIYTAQPVLNLPTGSCVVNPDSRRSYISIVSDGTTGAVISWIDSRYYNPSGYTIHAQAVNGSGTRQWDSDTNAVATDYNGLMIGFTGEYRSDRIGLVSYSYNDGGAYDPVFFWFDFRDYGVTEIYFDKNIDY